MGKNYCDVLISDDDEVVVVQVLPPKFDVFQTYRELKGLPVT